MMMRGWKGRYIAAAPEAVLRIGGSRQSHRVTVSVIVVSGGSGHRFGHLVRWWLPPAFLSAADM